MAQLYWLLNDKSCAPFTQTCWTSRNKDSCVCAMGQDNQSLRDFTPFFVKGYICPCVPQTGWDTRGYIWGSLSSDFPTTNKSPETKPRCTGVHPLLSLVTFCYQLCLGMIYPSILVQCSLSKKNPFNSSFVILTRIWPYGTLVNRKSRYKHHFLTDCTSSSTLFTDYLIIIC